MQQNQQRFLTTNAHWNHFDLWTKVAKQFQNKAEITQNDREILWNDPETLLNDTEILWNDPEMLENDPECPRKSSKDCDACPDFSFTVKKIP